MSETLNLGILAHVDAGKTTLTERLLYSVGAIPRMGSVDSGSTHTDSLELERLRGITIRSAVVSFVVGTTTVNLIDTPGHPDFIAEVERVLGVLDGAVLVVSAVESVQAQTRVLMRTLRRLHIPTLIFVNKVDRRGARCDEVLRDITAKLLPSAIAMGTVADAGTKAARCTPHGADDEEFSTRLTELLAEHDDRLLTAYLAGQQRVGGRRLRGALAEQTQKLLVHPVFVGSAMTGAGVPELIDAITELLPAATADATAPVSGLVFKVERGPSGEKIAYARLFSGTLRVRDQLRFGGAVDAETSTARVTALTVFEHGSDVRRSELLAGQIGKLWGLRQIRVGDRIGDPASAPQAGRAFPRPTLETALVPARAEDKGRLHTALTQLAEQDPLINLRQDDIRQEFFVSLYGEVQKEVLHTTLANEFDLDVGFRETTMICIERPNGSGSAVELIGTDGNPFLATVGLRVEPAPVDAGVDFRLEVELGSMPLAFITAVEEAARRTLREGLHGWAVADCVVTMTHSGYWARQSHSHGTFDKSMSSTAGDFKNLTPLVLADALRAAGTTVLEPIHRFRLELPVDTFGPMLAALGARRAVLTTSEPSGRSYLIEGDIPAAELRHLEQQLTGLTHGEGTLEASFDHHTPVADAPPARRRTDRNPLNRKEYLLRVARNL